MTMKNAVENFAKVAMNSGLTLNEYRKTVLDQYFCPFCGNAYGSDDTKKCHICGTRRKKQ